MLCTGPGRMELDRVSCMRSSHFPNSARHLSIRMRALHSADACSAVGARTEIVGASLHHQMPMEDRSSGRSIPHRTNADPHTENELEHIDLHTTPPTSIADRNALLPIVHPTTTAYPSHKPHRLFIKAVSQSTCLRSRQRSCSQRVWLWRQWRSV